MENKPKKLQLKKETMAVLNDPKMEKINGGGAPGQPGVPGYPGAGSAFTCDFGSFNNQCATGGKTCFIVCCHITG